MFETTKNTEQIKGVLMQKFLIVLGICITLSISANAETNNKANSTHATHLNKWLGTYTLQENLYMGSFTIQKCDKFNICEARYEAILHKSEFNDMHICEEVLMTLEIKNNNKAIVYYDGEEKCRLNLELNKNGILITEQKPKDCYMGCGVGTEISINRLYYKE